MPQASLASRGASGLTCGAFFNLASVLLPGKVSEDLAKQGSLEQTLHRASTSQASF